MDSERTQRLLKLKAEMPSDSHVAIVSELIDFSRDLDVVDSMVRSPALPEEQVDLLRMFQQTHRSIGKEVDGIARRLAVLESSLNCRIVFRVTRIIKFAAGNFARFANELNSRLQSL